MKDHPADVALAKVANTAGTLSPAETRQIVETEIRLQETLRIAFIRDATLAQARATAHGGDRAKQYRTEQAFALRQIKSCEATILALQERYAVELGLRQESSSSSSTSTSE